MIDKMNIALKNFSQEDFLFLLNQFVAHNGFKEISNKSGIGREGLYKVCNVKGNPKFDTLLSILKALRLQLKIVPYDNSFQNDFTIIRESSLGECFPALAKYWDQDKNNNLTVKDVTLSTKKKFWWKCEKNKNHTWKDAPSKLVKNFKIKFLKDISFMDKTIEEQLGNICPECLKD